MERLVVTDLASRASVERSGSGMCGPEPDAFRVKDLVVELELPQVLREPCACDEETLGEVLKEFLTNIRSHIAQSTAVVIRGCAPALRLRLSKTLMALQFGDLGQRCQWLDGVLLAKAMDSSDGTRKTVHRITTLDAFMDLVPDTTTCGNYLDGKDLNPIPPAWVSPLLDSTIAWNQTMHLRFVPKPNAKPNAKKNKQAPSYMVEEGGPSVIPADTWSSQGWRLVTHPGYLTPAHHDCCGMCTYVVGNSGAKLWAVMRPKSNVIPSSLDRLSNVLKGAVKQSEGGTFSEADIATVCLEEGDIM